jgi:hypothetical protein
MIIGDPAAAGPSHTEDVLADLRNAGYEVSSE